MLSKILISDAVPALYAGYQLFKGLPADKPNEYQPERVPGSKRREIDVKWENSTFNLRISYVIAIALNHCVNNFVIKKKFPKLGLCGRIATSAAMMAHGLWYERVTRTGTERGAIPALVFGGATILIHTFLPSRARAEQVKSLVIGLAETVLFVAASNFANSRGSVLD